VNGWLEIVDTPLARRIGWVLLHSLWQGALIGGLFAVSRFLLRRHSANSRYLAGCAALLLLIVSTSATFFMVRSVEAETQVSPTMGPRLFSIGLVSVAEGSSAGNPRSFLQASAAWLGRMAPWVTMVWLAGTIFFCLRLARSWWWVGKIRREENEPVEPDWLARLDRLRQRLGISRPVRLLKSALVEVPTVIGWLRPIILLPASSLSGLSPQQLEAILAHELAHVRRLDYLVNVFQCVLETLMFYHPVVWWISRQVRDERENCCDDLVIEVCGDRLIYARALTTLETIRAESTPLAFAATDGSLINRIRRLLGAGGDSQPITRSQIGGLALVGVGVLVMAAGVILFLSPPRYVAVTRIKVERELNDRQPIFVDTSVSSRSSPYDPYFTQTEFEVLQSELILNRTISALRLNETWGKKFGTGRPLGLGETVELLRQHMELRPIHNTSLIEIRVYGESPEEAASIANSIAESYRQHRLQISLDLMTAGIHALQDRLVEHEKKVEEAQAKVDRLRTELKILDSDPSSLVPMATLTADAVRKLNGEILLLRDTEVRQQRQLSVLQKLSPAELREAIPTALEEPDAVLATLMNELELAMQRTQNLLGQFPSNSSPVMKAKEAEADLRRKVGERVQKIVSENLPGNLEITRKTIAEKTSIFEIARSNDLRYAEMVRPYYDAKRRLSELLQFRTVLGMRIASEQTELTLPRNAMVIIVDRAFATSRRARSTRFPAAVLIGCGLVSGLIGIRLLRR
jgi:beta-lactamase regulating signal transducer with metallopeptidase domain/uncharacterized protein involved in exopolysaccharide biosynthesis